MKQLKKINFKEIFSVSIRPNNSSPLKISWEKFLSKMIEQNISVNCQYYDLRSFSFEKSVIKTWHKIWNVKIFITMKALIIFELDYKEQRKRRGRRILSVSKRTKQSTQHIYTYFLFIHKNTNIMRIVKKYPPKHQHAIIDRTKTGIHLLTKN